jgi:hypothetical protein
VGLGLINGSKALPREKKPLDLFAVGLRDLGEPQSPFWLSSQMDEMRLWKASEHDVRAALEKDIEQWGERTQFVRLDDDEYGLRTWAES